MEYTTLGRTGLNVSRAGFGALPIQRTTLSTGVKILQSAFDAGINFFDTARAYTDSEQKLGLAFKGKRQHVIIATKVHGKTKDQVLKLLEESLVQLKTDYVDILQLHNPEKLPDPADENSGYAGLIAAKKQGMTNFIGITAHRLSNAKLAIESNLYDVIQYPLSALSSEKEIELIELAGKKNIGFIAMKPLCGGLLTDIDLAFSFLWQFEDVIPIWGIQRMRELKQILKLVGNPPPFDKKMKRKILQERKTLGKNFCRGCGYCLPCPVEIPIPMAARMKFLLRRSPYRKLLEPQWQERMMKIEECKKCYACSRRCPYKLNTPQLLEEMLADYINFAKIKGIVIKRRKK